MFQHALQTGMSKKLRTLVDLEALLNDGAAYVLFKLFQASLPLLNSVHACKSLENSSSMKSFGVSQGMLVIVLIPIHMVHK